MGLRNSDRPLTYPKRDLSQMITQAWTRALQLRQPLWILRNRVERAVAQVAPAAALAALKEAARPPVKQVILTPRWRGARRVERTMPKISRTKYPMLDPTPHSKEPIELG